MEDTDFDEDLYEETTSKVVYKRSLPSDQELLDETEQDSLASENAATNRPGTDEFYSGEEEEREFSSGNKMEMDDPEEKIVSEYEWNLDTKNREEEDRDASEYDSNLATRERIRDEMHGWSERAKRATARKDRPQKSSPVRPKFSDHKRHHRAIQHQTKNPDDHGDYFKSSKWEVDYTNKNYIRSKCNKPAGMHRYILGRPLDWSIGYDNTSYVRSKVNAPKGLHRRARKVFERKHVPDKDMLADATGWEFEYGPEFDQVEEDVPYMPDDYIVTRGAYRCYGVKRNDSDSDRKIVEKHNEINELIEGELKYGAEFLQEDVPHVIEPNDRRVGRGAYRDYDVLRCVHDKYPEDALEVDYRTSRASIHKHAEDSRENQDTKKGKPFKRTIFKKIFYLGKPKPEENSRYGAHISFVPGEGSKTFYKGSSPRLHGAKEPRNIRNIFRPKKVSSYSEHADSGTASSPESKFSKRDYWKKGMRTNAGKVPSSSTFHETRKEQRAFHPRQDWEKKKENTTHEKVYPGRNSKPKDENVYIENDWQRAVEKSKQRRKREDKSEREFKSKDPWESQRRDPERTTKKRTTERQDKARHNWKQTSPKSFKDSGGSRRKPMKDEMNEGLSARENRFDRQRVEHSFPVIMTERREVLKKLPPHIESRIQILRKRMSQPELPVTNQKHSKGFGRHRHVYIDDDEEIDFQEHKKHPHDHGKSFKEGFEKYVTESGSEIWVKAEEKYSEIHHRLGKPKF